MSKFVLGSTRDVKSDWFATVSGVLDEIHLQLTGVAPTVPYVDQYKTLAQTKAAYRDFSDRIVGALKNLQTVHGAQFTATLQKAFKRRKINRVPFEDKGRNATANHRLR